MRVAHRGGDRVDLRPERLWRPLQLGIKRHEFVGAHVHDQGAHPPTIDPVHVALHAPGSLFSKIAVVVKVRDVRGNEAVLALVPRWRSVRDVEIIRRRRDEFRISFDVPRAGPYPYRRGGVDVRVLNRRAREWVHHEQLVEIIRATGVAPNNRVLDFVGRTAILDIESLALSLEGTGWRSSSREKNAATVGDVPCEGAIDPARTRIRTDCVAAKVDSPSQAGAVVGGQAVVEGHMFLNVFRVDRTSAKHCDVEDAGTDETSLITIQNHVVCA